MSLTETKTCLDTSNLAPRQLISKSETWKSPKNKEVWGLNMATWLNKTQQ